MDIVLVTLLFTEMLQSMCPAALGDGLPVLGGEFAHPVEQPLDVALLHHEAGPFRDRFDAAAGAVGHHRRAAGDGLEVDGRVIVLPGRVDEGRRPGIQRGEFGRVLRALDELDAGGEGCALLLAHVAHEQEALAFVQTAGQVDDISENIMADANIIAIVCFFFI